MQHTRHYVNYKRLVKYCIYTACIHYVLIAITKNVTFPTKYLLYFLSEMVNLRIVITEVGMPPAKITIYKSNAYCQRFCNDLLFKNMQKHIFKKHIATKKQRRMNLYYLLKI